MRISIYLFLFTTLFTLLLACEKEEIKRPFARVRTLPVTEVDSTGATFHAEVIDFNEDAITDYGFIWTTYPQNVINLPPNRFSYKSLGTNPNEKAFSVRVEAGLERGVVYYVRAYLRSAKSTVYGEEVILYSAGGFAPLIEKVIPKQVMPGDTITITGKYFVNVIERGRVTIGEEVATIVASDSTTVRCVVPRFVNDDAFIKVQSTDGASTTPYPMSKIIAPQITKISPNTLTIGDTLSIEGTFSNIGFWNEIEGAKTFVISSSRNLIKVMLEEVGPNGSSAYVTVKAGHKSSNFANFNITKPIIEDFYPKQGSAGDTITIVGNYFIPNSPYNFVTFGDFNTFNVIQTTKRELKVIVSGLNAGLSTSISAPLNVAMAGYRVQTSQNFKYLVRDWSVEAGLPGVVYQNGVVGFALQDKLYYNDGYSSDWWLYNEQSKNWRVGTTMPRTAGSGPTNDLAITIEENAYILQKDLENQDSLILWRYTPAGNRWLKLPSLKFPSDAGYYANPPVAFAIGRKLFLCLASKEQPCWVYDIDTQKWQPFNHYLNVIPPNTYEKPSPITAVAYGQKGYFIVKQITSQYVLEYNASSSSWKLLYEFPSDAYLQRRATFVFNNNILFLGLAQVFELNVNNQQLQRKYIDFLPNDGNLNEGQAIVISDRVFFAIGKYLYEWFPR